MDPTLQYMQYGVPAIGTQNVTFGSPASAVEPPSGRRKRAQQFLEDQMAAAQAGLGTAAETVQQKAKSAGQFIRTKPIRTGIGGGLVGGALMAVPSLLEGRPAEAVGGLAGSVAGGAAGAALGSVVPGVGTLIGGLAGSAIGGMLGGAGAEAAVSAYTGKPSAGSTEPGVPQPPRFIDTPLGRINLNDAAAQEDFLNRNQKRELDRATTTLGMVTSATKDLTQFNNQQEISMQEAMLPITTKLANDQLTRAQAMVNTQNNAYLQQMAVGGQINLALGAQRERGATMRQALATNPYVVALGAPNISIS